MAVQRIIACFNLKAGVSAADYEKWARTVDIPTVNALGSIEKFEVLRTTGLLGSAAKAPYEYIEIIDIQDAERFGKDVAMPEMQKVAADFQSMVNVVFITTEKLG